MTSLGHDQRRCRCACGPAGSGSRGALSPRLRFGEDDPPTATRRAVGDHVVPFARSILPGQGKSLRVTLLTVKLNSPAGSTGTSRILKGVPGGATL